MTLPVIWRPAALAELLVLYDWIASQADRATAYRYAAAIEAVTAALGDFPQGGAPRPDLGMKVRTLAYRLRTVIAYVPSGTVVEIVALAHAGRDLAARFGEDD